MQSEMYTKQLRHLLQPVPNKTEWGFPNVEHLLGGSYNKDFRIMDFIVGSLSVYENYHVVGKSKSSGSSSHSFAWLKVHVCVIIRFVQLVVAGPHVFTAYPRLVNRTR